MANTKRATKKKSSVSKTDPTRSRPYIPDYGIPKDKKGMLPWAHVSERMSQAMHYWVCTVDSEGRPHATPVDGVWLDDKLYFGGSTKTRRHRNLLANPAVCIHLESGMDVVILQGEAREFRAPTHAFAVQLAEASKQKYGYAPPPEMYETAEGVFAFWPLKVLAWTQFPKDATRWHLENKD
jgi:nitroimidazol reductase NimA-like FMN-containing flavoprotein (pyridoxamine 5'-phosphate oxidase superfamily)